MVILFRGYCPINSAALLTLVKIVMCFQLYIRLFSIVNHPNEVTILRLGAFLDRLTKLSSLVDRSPLYSRIRDVNSDAASDIGTSLEPIFSSNRCNRL